VKALLLTAGLLAVFAVCATKSYACFCVKAEVPEAYDEAKAVFIGEVTKIVTPRSEDPTALPAERLFTIKFKVEKSWKGAGFLDTTIPEISVLSDQGRTGCFSWGPFLEGRKYLVYAIQTEEKNLAVLFSCSRTASLAQASDDLKELRALQNPFFKFERKRDFLERRFFEGAHNKALQLTAR
jgi:hypothetical protein